jgi:hypothetical protein
MRGDTMAEKTTARELGTEAISFDIEESYLCGDEVADVGIIRTTGKLAFLRSYWEFDALEVVELPRRG